jgi:hypothetical protein
VTFPRTRTRGADGDARFPAEILPSHCVQREIATVPCASTRRAVPRRPLSMISSARTSLRLLHHISVLP